METESKKPYWLEITVPESEMIKLLKSYGCAIPEDYVLDSFVFNHYDETLDISLRDSTQEEG
jgi:hypothetical protein